MCVIIIKNENDETLYLTPQGRWVSHISDAENFEDEPSAQNVSEAYEDSSVLTIN